MAVHHPQRLSWRYPVLLAVIACGGGESGSVEPPPTTALARIVLAAPDSAFTSLGAVVQVSAVGYDGSGAPVTLDTVSWASSNPTVAGISSTGQVTVRANGSANITAQRGTIRATLPLTVRQQVARLALSATDSVLTAFGDTLALLAIGFDSGGAQMLPPSLTWSHSNAPVGTLYAPGRFRSLGNGTTVIEARSGSVTGSYPVRVAQAVTQLVVQAPPPFLRAIGATFPLAATARDRRNNIVLAAQPAWSSSAPSVVTISPTGGAITAGIGSTVLVVTAAGLSDSFAVQVDTLRRLAVDPFLATPAPGAMWEVPVVLLEFLPTADGATLDVRKVPDFHGLNPLPLDAMEARVLDFARRRKMMVEQGSRFRGYRYPLARPSIGYRVVEHVIVYAQTPPSTRRWTGVPGDPFFPDYFKIFAALGLDQVIPQQGVREVWVAQSGFDASYPSYDPTIHDPADMRIDFESNMASPTTGDISNSFRWNDDLPVYAHTYTVYSINFWRTQAEATHNVGHQLEAILSHVNQRQDGNTALFWDQFVGMSAGAFITGRAGWTHMPPNTTVSYDYLNPTPVASDIEDWRPDGAGLKTAVSSGTWGNLLYPWPGAGPIPQQVESQWYIYWMQNHPGSGNRIPHGTDWMTNWWAFLGDWDAAITSGLGLHSSQPAAIRGAGQRLSQAPSPPSAWRPVPERR